MSSVNQTKGFHNNKKEKRVKKKKKEKEEEETLKWFPSEEG